MAAPNPEPEVRHLATAGWCHLALGDNPKKGEEYLRQVLAWQIMDKASPEFGNWPWRVNHPEINDANSIDFAASFLAPPLLRYGAQLSEDFKHEAQDHLKAAIVAERRHQVPVSYGNIYLMKLSNLVMLGELTGDASAIEEGKADLKQWLAWTRLHGDNEYDSPTYAPVQLTGLEHVFLQAPDEATKALAKVGLDYLWSDLAANYFGPRDSLGGPHSRSYDFLYQKGTIQHHYYLEGLAPTLAGKDYLGGVWLNAIRPGCYHPAASILALGRIPERTIEQTFGAEPGRDRYNRITPDYDVGSVSAYYGPQDEQIAVEFASQKNAARVLRGVRHDRRSVRQAAFQGSQRPRKAQAHPRRVGDRPVGIDPARAVRSFAWSRAQQIRKRRHQPHHPDAGRRGVPRRRENPAGTGRPVL